MAEPYNAEQIDVCLQALIASSSNASAAVRLLKAQGHRCPSVQTLLDWSRTTYWERYEKLREVWMQQLETSAANDMREMLRFVGDAERLAVRKAVERLNAGKDEDPGRTAANLARVKQTNVDKMLSITGRPTQIVENRNLSEILRSLHARGVIDLPDEPKEIEGGKDAGDE